MRLTKLRQPLAVTIRSGTKPHDFELTVGWADLIE
jgi:hypothetical protein